MKTSDTAGGICFHCDINERMSCSAGREARQRLFSSLRSIASRAIARIANICLRFRQFGERRNRNYVTLTRECPAAQDGKRDSAYSRVYGFLREVCQSFLREARQRLFSSLRSIASRSCRNMRDRGGNSI